MPGSVEGGPGGYTHLLHVDLQDADRRHETSQEDHAKIFLERFLARGIAGGDAVETSISLFILFHCAYCKWATLYKWPTKGVRIPFLPFTYASLTCETLKEPHTCEVVENPSKGGLNPNRGRGL